MTSSLRAHLKALRLAYLALRCLRLALRCLHLFLVDASLPDRRLFWRVYRVAQREGVPVIPWQKPHVQTCTSSTVAGDYAVSHDLVRMFPGHHHDPWVLAHELGHRAAIRARHDATEAAADDEGRKILLATLSPTEVRAVLWRVNALLPEDPTPELERVLRRAKKLRALVERSPNIHEKSLARTRLKEIEPAEAHARATIGRRPKRDRDLSHKRRSGLFYIGLQFTFIVSMLIARVWSALLVPFVMMSFLLYMHAREAKWAQDAR